MGFLLILEHYLDQGHFQTAERDWQTALLVAIGLLLVQARSRRSPRVVLAAATACALTLRPHAILFLPAIASALDDSARSGGGFSKKSVVAIIEWGLLFAIFTLLAFSPLIAQGLVDDLARGSRSRGGSVWKSYAGKHYSRNLARVDKHLFTCSSRRDRVVLGVRVPRIEEIGADVDRRALGGDRLQTASSRAARLSRSPLGSDPAIAIARVAGGVLKTARLSSIVKLLIMIWIVLQTAAKIPSKCDAIAGLRGISDLARGGIPERAPIGCDPWYQRPGNPFPKGDYPWKDYRDVILYIKTHSRSHERVADLLRRMPFPPLNGVAGRLDVFPVESGIAWLWMRPNDVHMEEFLAKTLEDTPDSLVVREPDGAGIDPRMALKKIGPVVRKRYEVVARFGRLEVLRRRPRGQPESGTESSAPIDVKVTINISIHAELFLGDLSSVAGQCFGEGGIGQNSDDPGGERV